MKKITFFAEFFLFFLMLSSSILMLLSILNILPSLYALICIFITTSGVYIRYTLIKDKTQKELLTLILWILITISWNIGMKFEQANDKNTIDKTDYSQPTTEITYIV